MTNKNRSMKRWSQHSISSSLIYITLVFIALALVANCKSREVGSSGPTDDLRGGTLVFQDDFKREDLGDSWHRGTGEGGKGDWSIKHGEVEGSGLRNDPLWLKQSLPQSVRVEFDVKADTEVGDLKVEIFGDGENHASGYILIFGGWSNSLDVIARLDEHGTDRKSRETRGVEVERAYKMSIVRTSTGMLRWYVDGEEFMVYEDASPLVGDDHGYFAFSNWDARVRFSNLRIYDLETK